jgi:hypothetical protein
VKESGRWLPVRIVFRFVHRFHDSSFQFVNLAYFADRISLWFSASGNRVLISW